MPKPKGESDLTSARYMNSFLDDTVEGNFFEFTDPPGILIAFVFSTTLLGSGTRGNMQISFGTEL